jgi:hypothetical protein
VTIYREIKNLAGDRGIKVDKTRYLSTASKGKASLMDRTNDTTATALGYSITKSDLPEAENPRHVIFIDVGHSSLSAVAVTREVHHERRRRLP